MISKFCHYVKILQIKNRVLLQEDTMRNMKFFSPITQHLNQNFRLNWNMSLRFSYLKFFDGHIIFLTPKTQISAPSHVSPRYSPSSYPFDTFLIWRSFWDCDWQNGDVTLTFSSISDLYTPPNWTYMCQESFRSGTMTSALAWYSKITRFRVINYCIHQLWRRFLSARE